MPIRPQPGAIERVSVATPPFDAAYASVRPAGRTAIEEAVLMIAAPRRCAITGIAYLQQRNTLVRLTRMIQSQSSSAMVGVKPSCPSGAMPALLYRMSSAPIRATVSSTSIFASAGRPASAAMKIASPPRARTSAADSSPRSGSMSLTTTRAPSRAKASAPARPIPPPAPVMIAIRFLSRMVEPHSTPEPGGACAA